MPPRAFPALSPGPSEGWVPRLVLLALAGVLFTWATAAGPPASWQMVWTHGASPLAIAGAGEEGRFAADPLSTYGWALDAALLAPLRSIFPLSTWALVGSWIWYTLAGGSAAWLGGRWWGTPGASFAVGLAWQLGTAALVAVGASWGGGFVAGVLLPLVLGLWVRAMDRGTASAALASGLAAAPLLFTPGPGPGWCTLVCVPALAAGMRVTGPRGVSSAALAAGGALVAALPIASWVWTRGAFASPDLGTPSPALLLVGAFGAWRARRSLRRVAIPGLLVAIGLFASPDGAAARPVAELGLALLCGGAVAGYATGRSSPFGPASIVGDGIVKT